MKARHLIIAAIVAIGFSSCEKHNPLNVDEQWSVTIYTTLQYEDNPYGYGFDTLYCPYSGWPAELYNYFDISLIDTMLIIADTPFNQYTFSLVNGQYITPVNIYTYDKGYVYIDNLREDKYLLLRLTKGKWDYRYDWLEINRSQHNSVIYDTVSHCALDR